MPAEPDTSAEGRQRLINCIWLDIFSRGLQLSHRNSDFLILSCDTLKAHQYTKIVDALLQKDSGHDLTFQNEILEILRRPDAT